MASSKSPKDKAKLAVDFAQKIIRIGNGINDIVKGFDTLFKELGCKSIYNKATNAWQNFRKDGKLGTSRKDEDGGEKVIDTGGYEEQKRKQQIHNAIPAAYGY